MLEARLNHNTAFDTDELRVTQSLDSACDAIEIKTPRQSRAANLITPYQYQPIQITYNGTIITTATCERYEVYKSYQEYTLTISGRSPAAAMLDSSLGATRQWHGQSAVSILAELARPYGLRVRGSSIPFIEVSAHYQETIAELAQRIARTIGAVLQSEPDGNLVIAPIPPSIPVDTLNDTTPHITDIRRVADGAVRYGSYTIARITDGRAEQATSIDTSLQTPRAKIVIAENQTPNLQTAANWERSQGLRSDYIVIEYDTIKRVDGTIRAVGDVIDVSLPDQHARGQYIISQIEIYQNAEGEGAKAVLHPLGAYTS